MRSKAVFFRAALCLVGLSVPKKDRPSLSGQALKFLANLHLRVSFFY